MSDDGLLSIPPTSRRPPNRGIETLGLCLWYTKFQALIGVDLEIPHGLVTALIGPSGCGKSTLLRCFNRINERIPGVRTEGKVQILGQDIYAKDVDLVELRKRVGMVFQRPNPLPLSIRDNVLFGLRVHHRRADLRKDELDHALEAALKEVGLWESLRDNLDERATDLSLEQQQKLCIARLLPLRPEVLLMDEPCSALDAKATKRIEELIDELREHYTIVIVTHNMAQARRVSDECIFMLLGKVVEHTRTEDLFLNPKDDRTASYVEGRYG
jgi:phosphate transport system ATP-binding protein